MSLPNWVGPADADGYLVHNLMLVQTGRKSRAAGIRKCSDCDRAWIDDHAGLTQCPECRTEHFRRCAGCRARIRNTTDGDRYCDCCRDQLPLFDTGDI
jgi:predicted RNA-binding Zn-ribbon protein involved in translation (DUF1610 family)